METYKVRQTYPVPSVFVKQKMNNKKIPLRPLRSLPPKWYAPASVLPCVFSSHLPGTHFRKLLQCKSLVSNRRLRLSTFCRPSHLPFASIVKKLKGIFHLENSLFNSQMLGRQDSPRRSPPSLSAPSAAPSFAVAALHGCFSPVGALTAFRILSFLSGYY